MMSWKEEVIYIIEVYNKNNKNNNNIGGGGVDDCCRIDNDGHEQTGRTAIAVESDFVRGVLERAYESLPKSSIDLFHVPISISASTAAAVSTGKHQNQEERDDNEIITTLIHFLFRNLMIRGASSSSSPSFDDSTTRSSNLHMFHTCLMIHIEHMVRRYRRQKLGTTINYDSVEHHRIFDGEIDATMERIFDEIVFHEQDVCAGGDDTMRTISAANAAGNSHHHQSVVAAVVVTLFLYYRYRHRHHMGSSLEEFCDFVINDNNSKNIHDNMNMTMRWLFGLEEDKSSAIKAPPPSKIIVDLWKCFFETMKMKFKGMSRGTDIIKGPKVGMHLRTEEEEQRWLRDLSIGLAVAIRFGYRWDVVVRDIVQLQPKTLEFIDDKITDGLPPFLLAASATSATSLDAAAVHRCHGECDDGAGKVVRNVSGEELDDDPFGFKMISSAIDDILVECLNDAVGLSKFHQLCETADGSRNLADGDLWTWSSRQKDKHQPHQHLDLDAIYELLRFNPAMLERTLQRRRGEDYP